MGEGAGWGEGAGEGAGMAPGKESAVACRIAEKPSSRYLKPRRRGSAGGASEEHAPPPPSLCRAGHAVCVQPLAKQRICCAPAAGCS